MGEKVAWEWWSEHLMKPMTLDVIDTELTENGELIQAAIPLLTRHEPQKPTTPPETVVQMYGAVEAFSLYEWHILSHQTRHTKAHSNETNENLITFVWSHKSKQHSCSSNHDRNCLRFLLLPPQRPCLISCRTLSCSAFSTSHILDGSTRSSPSAVRWELDYFSSWIITTCLPKITACLLSALESDTQCNYTSVCLRVKLSQLWIIVSVSFGWSLGERRIHGNWHVQADNDSRAENWAEIETWYRYAATRDIHVSRINKKKQHLSIHSMNQVLLSSPR